VAKLFMLRGMECHSDSFFLLMCHPTITILGVLGSANESIQLAILFLDLARGFSILRASTLNGCLPRLLILAFAREEQGRAAIVEISCLVCSFWPTHGRNRNK
jgi:hypothetical protein